MKKKLLALLLCCAMAFSLMPSSLITSAEEIGFRIYDSTGAFADAVVLSAGETAELTALPETPAETDRYQWQIQVDETTWANISDGQSSVLCVSAALLNNELFDGSCSLRCRLTDGEGAVSYSSVTTLTLSAAAEDVLPAPETAQTPIIVSEQKITVLSGEGAESSEEPETEPSEEPEAAPTETPAEPSDEPEAVPTDAPAEPSEEPEAAPSEEPKSEQTEESVAPSEASVSLVRSFLTGTTDDASDVPSDPTDGGEGETPSEAPSASHTVTITYTFEDGTVVYSTYTQTFDTASGTVLRVEFPAIMGHIAYVNGVATSSYTIDAAALTASVTISVVYKPTDVTYTVLHYAQNLEDENYTELARETRSGLCGTVAPDCSAPYAGLYALRQTNPTLAADGTTVVEVYYNRRYVLLSFDTDGGTEVEPIYALYGTPFSVADPTKEGCTFLGWSTDGATAVTLPETVPGENTAYKALWQPGDSAQVTVRVWGQKADSDGYDLIKREFVEKKPGEVLTADNFAHVLTCTKAEHTHTSACNVCTHTHTIECYNMTKANAVSVDADVKAYFDQLDVDRTQPLIFRHYKYSQYFFSSNDFYVYLNGTYYNKVLSTDSDYMSSRRGAQLAPRLSEKKSGWHAYAPRYDYYYVYEALCVGHTHTADCYSCGAEEHTHTADCYADAVEMNSSLWKFARADTVTVAADGSTVINLYYDRVEYTLHFRKGSDVLDEYDTFGSLTARWGANIFDRFSAITNASGWYLWSTNSNGQYEEEEDYIQYVTYMPAANTIYYTYNDESGYHFVLCYYLQNVEDDGYPEKPSFYMIKNSYWGIAPDIEESDLISIPGFTLNTERSSEVGDSFSGSDFKAKLYYERNMYKLNFYDYTGELCHTMTFSYGESLRSADGHMPNFPSVYDRDEYVFDGWYTSADYLPDQKADFTALTMPVGGLNVYAHYVRKNRTVRAYLTKDALEGGAEPLYTGSIPYGTAVQDGPETPENGDMTFVGWFYTAADGTEKPFVFGSTLVESDFDVYAKWTTDKVIRYTIRYVLEGTDTEVAAPSTGAGLAYTTVTLTPKSNDALYEAYRAQYLPTESSKTLTLSEDGTMEVVFEYRRVTRRTFSYTIQYINTDTGTNRFGDLGIVIPTAVTDNTASTVTVSYQPIEGYVPDALSKTVALTAEGNTIITFYYTKNETDAPYSTTYYAQNLDGTWRAYASKEFVGTIGQTYSMEARSLYGFTLDSANEGNLQSGVLSADGLALKLYYTRNSYPYVVNYREQYTGAALAEPKTGTALFGSVVTEDAIEIVGYEAADASKSISIRVEPADAATINVINLYYKKVETATLSYEVVGPEGCGTVDVSTETVNALGTASGSFATASRGYRFVGWYTDAACTVPADESLVSGARLTPQKTRNYGTEEAPSMGYESATYYALFEEDVASLTISVTGADEGDSQAFLFTVSGARSSTEVVVYGNGSVTIENLPAGEYTVTEASGWSWRYTPDAAEQSATLIGGEAAELTFAHSRSNGKWLDGNASAKNVAGTGN